MKDKKTRKVQEIKERINKSNASNFEDHAFGTGMCEVVVAYPGTASVSLREQLDNDANSRNSKEDTLAVWKSSTVMHVSVTRK